MEDVDDPGAPGPPAFVGRADRQVEEAVTVEVLGGQGPPELIAELRTILDPPTVLMPVLAALGRQALGRPVEDVHDTAVLGAPVLVVSTDGQVVAPVTVEVGSGHRPPELVCA